MLNKSSAISRIWAALANKRPPEVDFVASPLTGEAPLTVNFTNLTTRAPTAFAWDFNNDGTIDSTVKNPTHTYTAPGNYSVTLSASNSVGTDSKTKIDYINVTAPPLLDFDYAVVRFLWDPSGGDDLDTRTCLINTGTPYDLDQIGWCKREEVGPYGTTTPYLKWGGDNTGSSGPEAHLIDFKQMVLDFPNLTEITIQLSAFWYWIRVSGNFQITFTTYLGGTMQQSGYDFINIGGTEVQSLLTNVNTSVNWSDCLIGQCIRHLRYVVATKTAYLENCDNVVEQSALQVYPINLNFNPFVQNVSPSPKTVTVKNAEIHPINIDGITVFNQTATTYPIFNWTGFTNDGNAPSQTNTVTLNAGETKTFTVTWFTSETNTNIYELITVAGYNTVTSERLSALINVGLNSASVNACTLVITPTNLTYTFDQYSTSAPQTITLFNSSEDVFIEVTKIEFIGDSLPIIDYTNSEISGNSNFYMSGLQTRSFILSYTQQTPGIYNNKIRFIASGATRPFPDIDITVTVVAAAPPPSPPSPTQDMILTFNTNLGSNTVELPLAGTVNVQIDWGDGNIEVVTSAQHKLHTYAAEGIYNVSISGTLTKFGFTQAEIDSSLYYVGSNPDTLVSVTSFGNIGLTDLSYAFYACSNLEILPDVLPSTVTTLKGMFRNSNFYKPNNMYKWNTSSVTDMSYMFYNASKFNSVIGTWNTSSVTDMSYMFANAYDFNQPLNDWDVSNVTDMSYMFSAAFKFNQHLDSWDTSSVINMSHMFNNAGEFNLSLSNWNTSLVTNMSHMFYGARKFNQTIESWNVASVTDMSNMFYAAESFNQPLNNWNVGNVTNMSGMFNGAGSFNQPLNNWNVSNVTNMSFMFASTDEFNQPLDNWNVSNVTNMNAMFYQTLSFNQPLNMWNVSSVTNMSTMFGFTEAFNQPLDNWNVSNVTNMSHMFYFAQSFNQPLDNWNVSNVTNMSTMFYQTDSFNQPLDNWDVSNVTDMSYMFGFTEAFNQPLNNWNVSSVTNMSYMFSDTYAFNQPLNNWNVSNVTNMRDMFYFAQSFNQPLDNWNVSNVTNMSTMFYQTDSFNQPLDNWDVSNVTDMSYMFGFTEAFNQPLNNWNVSSVTNMSYMFYYATVFNQNLTGWCVTLIPFLPTGFSTGSALLASNRPIWGTCPP